MKVFVLFDYTLEGLDGRMYPAFRGVFRDYDTANAWAAGLDHPMIDEVELR